MGLEAIHHFLGSESPFAEGGPSNETRAGADALPRPHELFLLRRQGNPTCQWVVGMGRQRRTSPHGGLFITWTATLFFSFCSKRSST